MPNTKFVRTKAPKVYKSWHIHRTKERAKVNHLQTLVEDGLLLIVQCLKLDVRIWNHVSNKKYNAVFTMWCPLHKMLFQRFKLYWNYPAKHKIKIVAAPRAQLWSSRVSATEYHAHQFSRLSILYSRPYLMEFKGTLNCRDWIPLIYAG